MAIGEQAVNVCREAKTQDGTCLALVSLGRAACNADDKVRASEALGEAMTIARQIGDIAALRDTLVYLWDVQPRQALEECEREVEQCRRSGDRETLAVFLRCLGRLRWLAMDLDGAAVALEETLALLEQCGIIRYSLVLGGIPIATANLGVIEYLRGNYSRAIELLERGIKLMLPTRDINVMIQQSNLASALVEVGQLDRASVLLRESLQANYQYAQWDGVYGYIVKLAWLARLQDQPARAARLLGMAEAIARCHDVAPTQKHVRSRKWNVEASIAAARAQLGDAAFDAAFAEGQGKSPEQAMAFALGDQREDSSTVGNARSG
jgi:tetratricopeptide (TPR) repeat protein